MIKNVSDYQKMDFTYVFTYVLVAFLEVFKRSQTWNYEVL